MQGILNSDVAAITSHRNVQSLQQYAEMEQENHAHADKQGVEEWSSVRCGQTSST